jgi:hypothetical protein
LASQASAFLHAKVVRRSRKAKADLTIQLSSRE